MKICVFIDDNQTDTFIRLVSVKLSSVINLSEEK